MLSKCDKCGADTKIVTRKYKDPTRGTFEKLQCLGGCKEGKYPYTMWPPRDKSMTVDYSNVLKSPGTHTVPSQAGNKDELVPTLKRIEEKIDKLLQVNNPHHVAQSEMGPDPDEELPF